MKRNILLCLTIALISACSKKPETTEPEKGAPATKDQPKLSAMSGDGEKGKPKGTAVKNAYVEKNWPVVGEGEGDVENEWTQEFKAAATPEEKIEVLGRKQSTGPEQLASLIRSSLREPNEGLRIEAAQTIMSLIDLPEEVPDLVMGAVHDPSSEVRAYAMESVNELRKETQIKVYEATIAAPDYDVRKTTIVELGRMHSKPAFEVLMKGLANEDVAFRNEVNFEINHLVNQQFESFEQANEWWEASAGNFSDDMIDTGGIE